jgi:RNA polymerase sigma-70 factor (ECF subfamily)
MSAPSANRVLSCISTSWSTVYKAHQGGQGEEVLAAQRRLLLRYYQPIFRYLRALVRDAEAAEELTHEFVVRFLRGDFRQADPARGRFRDLVKQALRHLAIDYWRHKRVEQERTPFPFREDGPGRPTEGDWRHCPPPRRAGRPAAGAYRGRARTPTAVVTPVDAAEAELVFWRGWRTEMLTQAWRALAQFQEQTHCSYHTVLRLRAERPEARCAELARLAAGRLGKPFSEAAFRQALCRAREKFADFLVAEVARTLGTTDPGPLEQELIDLDLLSYCRGSLARLRGEP